MQERLMAMMYLLGLVIGYILGFNHWYVPRDEKEK